MKKKIIALNFNNISDYDLVKYGLVSVDFDVIVCNLGPWLNDEFYAKDKIHQGNEELAQRVTIYAEDHFLKFIDAEDALIVSFLSYSDLVSKVYKSLNLQNKEYIVYSGVCYPKCPSVGGRELLARTVRRSGVFGFLRLLLNKFFKKIRNENYFKPASVVISGGKSFDLYPYLKCGEHVKSYSCHTFNYQRIITEENLTIANKGFVLFLDQYIPFHPDLVFEKNTVKINAEKYFLELRFFFDWIELKIGLPVKISLHPRAQYSDEMIEYYFGGREVLYNDSMKLTAEADLILSHGSGAVDYAVAFKKPIILISSKEVKKTAAFGCSAFAYALALNKKVIELDESLYEIDLNNEINFDVRVYDRFLSDYVRSSDANFSNIQECLSYFIENGV